MPQLSKKNQITAAALPLFLEHGIKGTSIDMVVRASKVSKPTVYNHFPDKESLFEEVIEHWIRSQAVPVFDSSPVGDISGDISHNLNKNWLTQDALRFYGIFLGEGFRAQKARQLFVEKFDSSWRKELANWAESSGRESSFDDLDKTVSDLILKALISG